MSGNNSYIYCVPFDSCRVAKFNPDDKSITGDIGPDFLGVGVEEKWFKGAMTDSGITYCPPIT